ncbi:hypothetical protein SERLADRAFT_403443 [Serpula lacrymans var. lacrymans S7.9]|nr:uncharacterized protein SERLADRAFT_403443 [Serpula lacrymans var. lacrymans S7.9]EGO19136.1 hypothetical protein SERLADRAFT_403443 [Serpula lacrymans var. lacrymans S7.9]
MVKPEKETIAKFNEQVNMSLDELEPWLESDQSHQAGTGVGLESGHKIVEILKKNPDKDPDEYEEKDLDHMRKVVGYNSRHLAQEDHLKETKTKEELEKTKSTISLRNWGHDPIKSLEKDEKAQTGAQDTADRSKGTEDKRGNADDDKHDNEIPTAACKNVKRKREESAEPRISRRKVDSGDLEVSNMGENQAKQTAATNTRTKSPYSKDSVEGDRHTSKPTSSRTPTRKSTRKTRVTRK